MNKRLGYALCGMLVAGCSAQPLLPPDPPEEPAACRGSGQNEQSCRIDVIVTPGSDPNAPCQVAVAGGQDRIAFRIATGRPVWIVWRLDRTDYAFQQNDGILFKDPQAPFSDGRPRANGRNFAARNDGKRNAAGPAEDYPYGIQIVNRSVGRPGCGFDPLIRNE
jgi:hypothetical protein